MGVAQRYVLNEENKCKRSAGNVMMLLCAMDDYCTFIVVSLSQVPQSVVCTFAQTG